jgi:hypothetical protein
MAGEILVFRDLFAVAQSKDTPVDIVLFDSGKEFSGQVTGAFEGGATASFSQKTRFAPPVGEEVRCEVRNEFFELPLEMHLELKHREDSDNQVEFRFEWSRPEEFKQQLTSKLQRTFNRRKYFRVPPDTSDPVKAILRLVDQQTKKKLATEAAVIEVGGGGITAEVDPRVEARLAGLVQVELEFNIPGYQTQITMDVTLKHRHMTGRTIRYGLQYIRQDTKEYEQSEEVIIDYVMKRQREILKVKQPDSMRSSQGKNAGPGRRRLRRRR